MINEEVHCAGCGNLLRTEEGNWMKNVIGTVNFIKGNRVQKDFAFCERCLDKWRDIIGESGLRQTLQMTALKMENEQLKEENDRLMKLIKDFYEEECEEDCCEE